MTDFEEASFKDLAIPPAVFAFLAGLVAIPLGQEVLLDILPEMFPPFAVGIAASLTGSVAVWISVGAIWLASWREGKDMPWWVAFPIALGSMIGTLAAIPVAFAIF